MNVIKRNINLWLLAAYFWAIIHIFIPHHHQHHDHGNDVYQNHQHVCEADVAFHSCEGDHHIGQLHTHQPYLKITSNQYFIPPSFYRFNPDLQFLNYYLKHQETSYVSKFFASSLRLRAPPELS